MPDLEPRRPRNTPAPKVTKITLSGFGGSERRNSNFLTGLFKSKFWGFVSTWGIVTIIFVVLIGTIFGRYNFFEQYMWTLAITVMITFLIKNPPNILLAAPLLGFLSNIQIGGAIRTIWSALVFLFFVLLAMNFVRYNGTGIPGASLEQLIVKTVTDMRLIVGVILSEIGKLLG